MGSRLIFILFYLSCGLVNAQCITKPKGKILPFTYSNTEYKLYKEVINIPFIKSAIPYKIENKNDTTILFVYDDSLVYCFTKVLKIGNFYYGINNSHMSGYSVVKFNSKRIIQSKPVLNCSYLYGYRYKIKNDTIYFTIIYACYLDKKMKKYKLGSRTVSFRK